MPVRLFKDKNVHAKNSWWRDADPPGKQLPVLSRLLIC